MNKALFQAMFKNQGQKALAYAGGLSSYNLLLIGVYPALSHTSAMADLTDHLPNSVKQVFGIRSDNEFTTFSSFVSSQCFGQIWLLVTGIYVINTADELIASLADQGSLAYLLASPLKRQELFYTQTAVLAGGLALFIILTALGIFASTTFFKIPFDIWPLWRLAVSEFALFMLIGSYSLLFSVLSLNSSYAMLSTSALTFLAYAFDILSGLDDRFLWIKDFTPFGWIRPEKILAGEIFPFRILGLFSLSALLTALSATLFSRKDIHV